MLYIAFLRGINIGGRNVRKHQFIAPFEAAGFTDVSTFIASGNVIATTTSRKKPSALEAQLETALAEAFGFEVATFLRTGPQLAAIGAHEAFPDVDRDDAHTLHVTFLREPPAAAVRDKVLAAANDEDRLAFAGSELYWLRHGGLSSTTLTSAQQRLLSFGAQATARNMTTVRKLAQTYGPP